jgi:acyl carrier protein
VSSDSLEAKRRVLVELRLSQERETQAARERIRPRPRAVRPPLSFQQEDLWFVDQWAPGLPIYNMPYGLRFRGELQVGALRRALTRMVGRHESLRTRFVSQDGVPYQVIDPPPAELPVRFDDLLQVPGGEREQHAAELITAEVQRSFDLAAGPLLRVMLLRTAPDEHVLLLTMHHIVGDGWSVGALTHELTRLYEAFRRGEPDPLPPLEVQYADFAAWQRERLTGEVLERQLAYWTAKLDQLTPLELESDHPRPAKRTWAGWFEECEAPSGLYHRVRELTRAERVSSLAPLLAAFVALLARVTGSDDVAVGSVLSGRTRSEIEPLIGYFCNTVVLRTSAAGDPTLRELLARANDTAVGALAHQDLPFGKLVNSLRPERDPTRNRLFQVAFAAQLPAAGAALGPLTVEEVGIWQLGVHTGTSRFDMTVNLGLRGDRLVIATEYSTELFAAERVRRLHQHFQQVLEQVARDPGVRLSELDLPAPRQRLDLRETAAPAVPPTPAEGPEAHGAGDGGHRMDQGSRAPSTSVEQAVAEIWREVLEVPAEELDVHAEFFAVGGTSLRAVQLMTRIRETFQVEVDLPTVFTEGTIARLAELIDQALAQAAAALPDEEMDKLLAEVEGLSDEEVLRLLEEGGQPGGRPQED